MTAFWGADTDQLRTQGRATTTGADALAATVTSALNLARQVTWSGHDAAAFRDRCASAEQLVQQTLDDLRRRAEELSQQAEQQDETSAAAGGTGAGGGAASGATLPGPGNPFGAGNPFGFGLPFGSGLPDAPLVGSWPFGAGSPIPSPFGPLGPMGPNDPLIGLGEDIVDVVRDGGSWDVSDRIDRWSAWAESKVWDPATDALRESTDWLKDSKAFDVGRKIVPVVPDLFSAGSAALDGDAEAALWSMNRSAFEAIPGVTVGDLLGGEITSRLGDEHTVFGSDIRWNEGTPMDGIEAYMVQRTRETGFTEPGEAIGVGFADRAGIENETARNVLKSTSGVGIGVTFNSPAAWAFDAVTPGDQRGAAYRFLDDHLT